MSLKTTSGSDLLYRTASVIDHNAAYTILSWHRIDTDTNNYAHFQHVGGTRATYDGNTDFIGTDADGTIFRYGSAGGATNTFATGSPISVGSWFWVALVRETSTSLKVYRGTDNTDGSLVATVTDNVGSRAAASALALGGYNTLPVNGLTARPRIWTKALTLAGLHTEVASAATVDTGSLWSTPAFLGANVAAALLDTSGNGRDFSQDGTVTLGGAEPPTFGSGPSITTTSSANPADGSSLTITGTAFGAAQGAGGVTIGGEAQVETSWSDTSIAETVAVGANKYLTALNIVVTDNALAASSPFALASIQPHAGWSAVDVTSIAALGWLEASPPVAVGDQIEYLNNSGGTVVYADTTFSTTLPFDFRVWTPGFGWGSVATQTIGSARKMRTPYENLPRGGADVWDSGPAGEIIVESFFETAVASGGTTVKAWSGSAWVAKPVKYWNGSAWTTKPIKRWNGSAWV